MWFAALFRRRKTDKPYVAPYPDLSNISLTRIRHLENLPTVQLNPTKLVTSCSQAVPTDGSGTPPQEL